jgi:VWFA-related protein
MTLRFLAMPLAFTLLAGGQGRSTSTPPQQPQQPVFRESVDVVQMDVIVRDDKNRFVPGLTAADFAVFEDGVRQSISVFRPFVGGRQMNVASGTGATPSRSGLILPPRARADTTGRVFIVFIDDLNFQFKNTSQVRRIMDLIKTVVQEEDLVGYVSSGYSSIQTDLVHDYGYKHLEEAMRKTSGSGMDSKQIIAAAQSSQGPVGLRYMAHTAMRTANDIVDNLSSLRGVRKSFLYISEGYNFDPYAESRLKAEQERYGLPSNPSDGADTGMTRTSPFQKPGQQFSEADLTADLAELIRHANRSNVAFYTIDPRGLSAGPDIDEQVSMKEHREHMVVSVNSLRAIAENTGGQCICETNDFKGGLARINDETSDYYMLGYSSTNRDPTDRVRLIRIEMQKPGITAKYRTEYTLPKK